MAEVKILWADDEIDLLKPHLLFLEQKGYSVTTVSNGVDAVDEVRSDSFDLIFLDENMPGISGLEALKQIKEIRSDVPVVMITKSEEEHIMEDAIGSKIEDYLIKPVNPKQILMSIKRILDNKRLVTERVTSQYQQEFRNIGMSFMDRMDFNQWKDTYKKLVYFELEMDSSERTGMEDVLETQKIEANKEFSKFIVENYTDFLNPDNTEAPIMSHTVLRKKVIPEVEKAMGMIPTYLLVIDNLRFDQWKTIMPALTDLFRVEEEDIYLSILPTTTQYCRNAMFSGLLPIDIEKRFPNKWSNDEDEGGKNNFENDFLEDLLQRLRKDYRTSYQKILNLQHGKGLVDNIPNLIKNELNTIVYNFVDNLSHARTDIKLMRELAEDEKAYRSLTLSWFLHSPLYEALKKIAEQGARVIITTDHGSVKVNNPVKIIGDKKTTTNLRYKTGRNLALDKKDAFIIKDPSLIGLPMQHMTSTFAFCWESDFFVYPNNLNYYAKYYKDTIQHGGISMEEMLIPLVVLKAR